MCRIAIFIAFNAIIACFLLANPALATTIDYTTVRDAQSGSEPSLYETLLSVAPGYDWTDTAYLNSGAGSRRIPDSQDLYWYATGNDITVTLLTAYWGGRAEPFDSLGQEIVFSHPGVESQESTFPSPRIDEFGESAVIPVTDLLQPLVFGDESGLPTAWTTSPMNRAFANGTLDRVISFDVRGLDIFAWNGQSFQLTRENANDNSYILAFDPGSDQDYQDLLILVEGVRPIPEPTTLLLFSLASVLLVRSKTG